MKKNYGILIFLLSIALTTLGSILKVMNVQTLPDIFLGLGVIAFILGVGLILYKLFKQQPK